MGVILTEKMHPYFPDILKITFNHEKKWLMRKAVKWCSTFFQSPEFN